MTAKPKRGRPTGGDGWNPRFIAQAKVAGEWGATDEQLARFFATSVRTIYRWKESHPEFGAALERGKAISNARVERSLFERATGYSHPAVKIFMPAGASEPVYAPYTEHYPPDATSMIFWLKNRDPERWRDKTDHEHTGKDGTPLVPVLNISIGAKPGNGAGHD